MVRAVSFLSLVVLGASCASMAPTVGGEPTVLWENARPREAESAASLSESEARRIARAHDAAFSCEGTARAMAKRDEERGWQVMRQCIMRSDFTDLELLLEGEWADRVKDSADAHSLLAHVIAVRGGDVESDLRLLRRRKMPLFSLAAALTEPSSYAGRFVLVRGTAKNGRAVDNGRAFDLIETKVMAESEWVTTPGTARQSSKRSGAVVDRPGVDISGRGLVEDSQLDETSKVEVLHNVSVETGRSLMARLQSGEPSLEPAVDYIIVVRFKGLEKGEADLDGEYEETAVGEVVDYYEPETSRFARLGR
jgi:hypothetical protein